MTESQEPEDFSSPGIPLCVDLDGTLIRSDLLYEALARLSKEGFVTLIQAPFWLSRGRAGFKREVANRVALEPSSLPYDERLIEFLRGEKSRGRRLVLVTASDRRWAEQVAAHLELFDEVMGSDGSTNLGGRDQGARARGALRRPGIRLRGKRADGHARLEEGAARHRRERAARDRERPEAGWKSGGVVPIRSSDREDARRGDPDAPVGEESSRLHPDHHRPQASGRGDPRGGGSRVRGRLALRVGHLPDQRSPGPGFRPKAPEKARPADRERQPADPVRRRPVAGPDGGGLRDLAEASGRRREAHRRLPRRDDRLFPCL